MQEEKIEFLLYCPSSILELGYETRGTVKCIPIKTFVHSNELTHHHRPHVHIEISNNTYVCSIDNIIQVLEPKKLPHGISSKIQQILTYPNNLSECRKEWNRCINLVKFNENEINFKSVRFVKDNNGINVII